LLEQLLHDATSSSSSSSRKRQGSGQQPSAKTLQQQQQQQQQQQASSAYRQVPPAHVKLFEALGVPVLEVMSKHWAATPSGTVVAGTAAPGSQDGTLLRAAVAATLPSMLALEALSSGRSSRSYDMRRADATGVLVELKLPRGVAQPLLLCLAEAALLGDGIEVITQSMAGSRCGSCSTEKSSR
jgi:hypothetical protein